MSDNRPNIIFYFSDQQRYDTVCQSVTPNLENLKSEGVEFTNAYTCQPVCGPARACLQTGVYASENGCYVNNISMNENAVTIAKLLGNDGYDTAYIGKWHLASDIGHNYQKKAVPDRLRGGYRYWMAADCLEFTSDGYGGYVYDSDNNKREFDYIRSDAINDFAMEYLEKRDKDKPFFMFVSQIEPHHQNSTDQYECPEGSAEKFKDFPIPQDLTALKGNYESRYADYLACCERLDYNVGRLIERLKQDNLWENTILIYTSDHGCHFKTRNMEYKRSAHDASIHVPMIICGGKFIGGKRCEEMISLIDIPTTLLSLAGISPPKEFKGNNLAQTLSGEKVRDHVYFEMSESQLGRGIRTKQYTYSVKKPFSMGLESPTSSHYVEDKLYDNTLDPNQLNNLIRSPKHSEIRRELRQILLNDIKEIEGKDVKIRRRILPCGK